MKESNPIRPPLGYEQRLWKNMIIEADPTKETQENLENQIKELEAMISRVPGIPAPIKKHHVQSFADFSFTEKISMIEMPSRFNYPTMKIYDDNGDPDDHIVQYKQMMHTTVVHQYQGEAYMCKGFKSSFFGPALQWFVSMPNGSISFFAELHDLFIEQFTSIVGKLRRDRSTCARSNNEPMNHFNYTLQYSIEKKQTLRTTIKRHNNRVKKGAEQNL